MFVSIVDYGMGNVKSIKNACQFVGLKAEITNSPNRIKKSSGIILPGIGAFGTAMSNLKDLGLDELLKTEAQKGKPFLGVCLGMQLLMSGSEEFGINKGLDIIKGKVVRLKSSPTNKLPHIGWNVLTKSNNSMWRKSLLKNIRNNSHMYFVHSFQVIPKDKTIIVSTTSYGTNHFCSSLHLDNIFGCQYHPERSGPEGLKIYEEFKNKL